jgi:integrase
VFRLLTKAGDPMARTRDAVGPIVSAIGAAAAGAIVDQREKRNDDGDLETVPAYASAHDLRRAFGFRWSRLIMPPVLKEQMRRTDISTTMKFYVGVNAKVTAEELWRVVGNKVSNTAHSEAGGEAVENRRNSLSTN